MSTGTFVSGKVTFFKITPSGGTQSTMQVTEHSWSEQIDKIDVTHTGSGGIQALLAGILRGTGNVKAFFDSTAKYYDTTRQVKAGTNGVFQTSLDGTLFYGVPAMITKVNKSAAVAGAVSYDFDIELNSEAGTYVYPV